MLDHLPFWLLLLIFVVCAAVIWVAGIQLSKTTDRIDARLHLGSAVGGLVVLALATNLPEIVITVTAAASGSVEVAVGNILGGIALQTVVLVILDRFGKRAKGAHPLTYRAASLSLLVEALVVIAVLAVVVAGTQLPKGIEALRLTPQALLIAAVWIIGLLLVRRAGSHLPWDRDGAAPDSTPHRRSNRAHAEDSKNAKGSKGSTDSKGSNGSKSSKSSKSFGRTVSVFVGAALATLVAGFFLEQSGDSASSQIGLSGILFGATVLALATSLPEISTGLQAIRQGDEDLAVSDIFGGNAFLPVLFLVAGLVSGKAVLPTAGSADVYLTALAALLTVVYAFGLLFRPKRRVLGMGVDSLTVLALYVVGVAGLFAVAG